MWGVAKIAVGGAGPLHGRKVDEYEMVGGRWEHQDEVKGGDLHRLGPLHGRMMSRHQGWEIST